MPFQVVIGAQWGDEGKGRIVDWYAAQADITARYNGGDNAGHTVTVGGRVFKLHLIPSGILRPGSVAVLGSGMVINPQRLLDEIETLRQAGIAITPECLRISYAAHLITPAHLALDQALEVGRAGDPLGTTGRGIGPAYTDKTARQGLRMADLLTVDFPERLKGALEVANRTLRLWGAPTLDPAPVCAAYHDYTARLKEYLADTCLELELALKAGRRVLAEGAQGTLLDIDHGTYPFVTSSSCVAPAALTGLGLGLSAAQGARVTGVVKAFQTRVGSGPFPTELTGKLAERLRGSGEHPWDEYGTTTGRPRRVGWLDGVLLRYAVRVNGLTELAITKLDVLTGLKTIRVCTSYRAGSQPLVEPPIGPAYWSQVEPVYEDFPGWQADVSKARSWKQLPSTARGYLERLQSLADIPIALVSVGPEREQLIQI